MHRARTQNERLYLRLGAPSRTEAVIHGGSVVSHRTLLSGRRRVAGGGCTQGVYGVYTGYVHVYTPL